MVLLSYLSVFNQQSHQDFSGISIWMAYLFKLKGALNNFLVSDALISRGCNGFSIPVSAYGVM